jgi:hypothetical protein
MLLLLFDGIWMSASLQTDLVQRPGHAAAGQHMLCLRATRHVLCGCPCRAKTAEGATIVVKFGEGIAGTVAQRGGSSAASKVPADRLKAL